MASKQDILDNLNEKEKLILKLMVEGLRTSEISKFLSLSYHDTAELSRTVKQKLNVSTVVELKNIAEQTGLH
jgi:DNA-binding CsgD family transcriptional regulator